MTEITLTHGEARATIALLGAEARGWRIAGRDLLWPGDPAIWSHISPILYPVVGWTRDGEERVDGVTYKLGLHGFARFETFAVESSGPDFARLTLSDNARTRAVYPFAFALAIEYRLSDDALRSPSKSPIPGISARLTPAGCTPVSAGLSARRAAPALSFSSRRTSGPRFPNSRPAASSARPRG